MNPVPKVWNMSKEKDILEIEAENVKKPSRKRTTEDIVKQLMGE